MEKYYNYRNSRIVLILFLILLVILLGSLKIINLTHLVLCFLGLIIYVKFLMFNCKRIYNKCIEKIELENNRNLKEIKNNTKRED